jgi:hypothetical protein
MAFGIFDILYKIASARDVNPLTFLIVQSATAHILINLYVALHEKYPLNRVVLQIAPCAGSCSPKVVFRPPGWYKGKGRNPRP